MISLSIQEDFDHKTSLKMDGHFVTDFTLAVIDIDAIFSHLKAGQVLVGLDLGVKTIGIAASDVGLCMAHPRTTIRRTKFGQDAKLLMACFARENAGVAVIGLPLNMDGTSGPRVQSTRAFVRNMADLTDMPFVFWDERLSSLIAMDVSRTKRAERIDCAAAAFILQGVLDRLRFHDSQEAG